MTRLADLLGHDHPLFLYNILALEKASGNPGIDTRLIADCAEKSHRVMSELGLDAHDTLASELYHALQAAVRRGDAERILRDTSYVLGIVDEHVVSFNLQDVVENAHHELAMHDRTCEHARRNLRQELIRRYAEHEKTDTAMVHKYAEEAGLIRDLDDQHPVIDDIETRPTLYAIGDIFSDVFIQLDENESSVEKDSDGNEWLKIPFGSKPPYESATTVDAVGPSPNAAVACARLGVGVSLLSWMGDDAVSSSNRTYLDSEHIDHLLSPSTDYLPSNTYYVLRRGAERTILVKNQEYAYDWVEPKTVPDWIYLSLISDASFPLHEKLASYLKDHPAVKLAFQPGTFHFKWGAKKLSSIYKRTEILVVNREEAVDITGGDHKDLESLARKLHALGPKIVVVTDGKNGSYALFDEEFYSIENYPDIGPPVDRTGAGDAFASTIVAALALGETMETALLWAPINSMNVVQKLGAQAGLQSRRQIGEWLKKAPRSYKVKKITKK